MKLELNVISNSYLDSSSTLITSHPSGGDLTNIFESTKQISYGLGRKVDKLNLNIYYPKRGDGVLCYILIIKCIMKYKYILYIQNIDCLINTIIHWTIQYTNYDSVCILNNCKQYQV